MQLGQIDAQSSEDVLCRGAKALKVEHETSEGPGCRSLDKRLELQGQASLTAAAVTASITV